MLPGGGPGAKPTGCARTNPRGVHFVSCDWSRGCTPWRKALCEVYGTGVDLIPVRIWSRRDVPPVRIDLPGGYMALLGTYAVHTGSLSRNLGSSPPISAPYRGHTGTYRPIDLCWRPANAPHMTPGKRWTPTLCPNSSVFWSIQGLFR